MCPVICKEEENEEANDVLLVVLTLTYAPFGLSFANKNAE